jgi:hypothetical protein
MAGESGGVESGEIGGEADGVGACTFPSGVVASAKSELNINAHTSVVAVRSTLGVGALGAQAGIVDAPASSASVGVLRPALWAVVWQSMVWLSDLSH